MVHPFRDRVSASLRRTFGAPGASGGLGAVARYTPAGGGAAIDIRVLPVTRDAVLDAFAARTLQTGHAFDVMADDVGARPEAGATLALLDAAGAVTATYTLTEPALTTDKLRMVWRCATGPAVLVSANASVHDFRDAVTASLRRTWGAFGSASGLGADALFTPAGGGAAIMLRVMPLLDDSVHDDPFGARTWQERHGFDVMMADVATRPETGATISLLDADGVPTQTFTLIEPALSDDALNRVWRCATGAPVDAATIVDVTAGLSAIGRVGAPALIHAVDAVFRARGALGPGTLVISIAAGPRAVATIGGPTRICIVSTGPGGVARTGVPLLISAAPGLTAIARLATPQRLTAAPGMTAVARVGAPALVIPAPGMKAVARLGVPDVIPYAPPGDGLTWDDSVTWTDSDTWVD